MVGSVASMIGSVDPDRTEWDVIVIGGGPPGENVAAYTSDGSGLTLIALDARGVITGPLAYTDLHLTSQSRGSRARRSLCDHAA